MRLDGHIPSRHRLGNRLVPTEESVTGLGRSGRSRDCRAVVLCDGSNLRTAVGVEGDGILIDDPRCLDGHVPSRHRLGNLLIPSIEGVAGLGRSGRSGDSRGVVLRDGSNLRTAVGVEGDGVLIDGPLCLDGRVLGWHDLGQYRLPSGKGVARLGWSGRSRDGRGVVLRNGSNSRTTIGVEGDGELGNQPLSLDGHVLSRHRLGNQLVPTEENVTHLGRVGRSRDSRGVILRDGSNLRATVGVEGDGVLVCGPLRLDGRVLGRHRLGQYRLPASKGVARLGRSGRSRDSRGVVLRDGFNFRTAVGVEGDGVLIDGPLCLDGRVLGWHRLGQDRLPASKGVARLGRRSRSGDGRGVVLRNGSNLRTAVDVEGDGVLVDGPRCIDGHVPSRHRRRNLLIPSSEGVARLGRIGRSVDCCLIVLGDNQIFLAIVQDKRQGVRIYFPIGLVAAVASASLGDGQLGSGFREIRAEPSPERIARARRIVQREGFVFDGVGGGIRHAFVQSSSVQVIGDGIDDGLEYRIEGQIGSRHFLGNLSIPVFEGVARLLRILGRVESTLIDDAGFGYGLAIDHKLQLIAVDGPLRREGLVTNRNSSRHLRYPSTERVARPL